MGFFEHKKQFSIVALILVLAIFLMVPIGKQGNLYNVGVAYATDVWVSNAAIKWVDGDEILTFDRDTIKSGAIRTSATFKLGKYTSASWSTFPFQAQFDMDVSPAPTVLAKAQSVLQGSIDLTNWHTAQTLTSTTGSAVSDTTFTFGNAKWPYYRLQITNNHGTDTTLSYQNKIFLYQN